MNKSGYIFIFTYLFTFFSSYSQTPYEIKKKTEVGIGIGIMIFGGFSMYSEIKDTPLTTEQLNNLNINNIPRFDRSAVNKWSPTLSGISDAGLLICMASPVLLMSNSYMREDIAVFGIMFAENIFTTLAFTAFVKSSLKRIRSYVYNPDVEMEKKLKIDAKRSFFSGHTSLAFSSAVFTSTVFSRYNQQSPMRSWIWGSTLATAATVGFLRYASGKHFPSDIITGAIVGSALGYIIPLLHEKK